MWQSTPAAASVMPAISPSRPPPTHKTVQLPASESAGEAVLEARESVEMVLLTSISRTLSDVLLLILI
jgi:hypothetical protein